MRHSIEMRHVETECIYMPKQCASQNVRFIRTKFFIRGIAMGMRDVKTLPPFFSTIIHPENTIHDKQVSILVFRNYIQYILKHISSSTSRS